jgi:hypothetical protein
LIGCWATGFGAIDAGGFGSGRGHIEYLA